MERHVFVGFDHCSFWAWQHRQRRQRLALLVRLRCQMPTKNNLHFGCGPPGFQWPPGWPKTFLGSGGTQPSPSQYHCYSCGHIQLTHLEDLTARAPWNSCLLAPKKETHLPIIDFQGQLLVSGKVAFCCCFRFGKQNRGRFERSTANNHEKR